jgi:hypothetical protein
MIISEVINHEKLKVGEQKWMLSTKEKELVQFMKKNCSDIIGTYEWEEQYLYRGMRQGKSNILLAKTREDRNPMDTPPEIQSKLDKVLASQGFIALRSNSIFCSSNFEYIHDYGSPFMIFPVNGFTYTWNSDAKDLYKRYQLRSLHSSMVASLNDPDINPAEFVKDYKFKNNEGLSTALRKGNEVCIHGSYVAIDCEVSILTNILLALGLHLPDWSDYYGTDDDDVDSVELW